jgi:surface protein
MNDMFDSCSNLEELDLSNFDTSNVTTSMGRMFGGCNKLEKLNMSGWNFSKMGSFDIMPMFWTSAG